MSVDFSALWNAINAVISGIQGFFNGVWAVVQNITNTGQGIFAGLASFGSSIWDAFVKFGESLRDGFVNAFTSLGEWFRNAFNTLGSWLNEAFKWIKSGLETIGGHLYNFGKWLYDGLVYVYNLIASALTTLWNAIQNFFSGVATALQTWWGNVTRAINLWWTANITSFRRKLRDSIFASLTISAAYKAAEKVLDPDKLDLFGEGGYRKLFGGVAQILLSPFVALIPAAIIDAMIPTPSTSVFPLIPELPTFTYTPTPITTPQVRVSRPIEETISEYAEVSIRPIIG